MIGERDGHVLGVCHDVSVGEDIAVGVIKDEARALLGSGGQVGFLRYRILMDHDVDHRWRIVGNEVGVVDELRGASVSAVMRNDE